LFREVKQLDIEMHGVVFVQHWASFISALINLTTVVELNVTGRFITEASPSILAGISTLLQQTCNLSSLRLGDVPGMRPSAWTAENLCPLIPCHVKRLVTPVKNLEEAEKIFNQFGHVSTVEFRFAPILSPSRNIDWLSHRKRCSTYVLGSTSLQIWLRNSNMESINSEVEAKRMKLTVDDHSTPGLGQDACQEGRRINQDKRCWCLDELCDNRDDIFC
jgi:hypothetical protein